MKKIDNALTIFMRFIMAAAMLAIVVTGTWQVASRLVFNSPSTITEELMRYMLIWAGMIGAAYCFYKNQHIALDLLKSRLKGVPKIINHVFCEIVIIFFVFTVFLYGGWAIASTATHHSPVMQIPMRALFMVLPLSGAFIILARIMSYIQLILDRNKPQEEEMSS